ncbi:MAG: phosphoribosylamine--glycine ligase [Flavobacteriaceae bacterium]|jgi:phosphoribosylamine--glycine ligase|nr:phosphoribosylamine--glycine ligase [Flavobacteriaceae bacterium]|tara:strand:+ start:4684 stop:5964 length:1281 start_codon:yes stop_codon:yes gene_type:complete
MEILVIGSGGREHALAWKLAKSSSTKKIYVAPGNAGTASEEKIENVAIDSGDIEGLLNFALSRKIKLTIVGPEDPLVHGIVDRFSDKNLLCLGPNSSAAQLEGSKAFMKDILVSAGVPTAKYEVFDDPKQALMYIETIDAPIVIKADGLAAGKGVVVAHEKQIAIAAVNSIMNERKVGDAGSSIIIEDFLLGQEASFIVLTDGKNIVPFATSQDHKQRDDGDKGPNTGGMGAYSPTPLVTEKMHDEVMEKVITPTLNELNKRGIEYKGFLYAGLMIDGNEIKVLEYNCRFGDPETQPILMRMKTDFAELCLKACEYNLKDFEIIWDEKKSIGVVMASGGYPESYRKGYEINGIPKETEDLKVFHCGTVKDGDLTKTNGGRVLCVTALGETLPDAISNAYESVNKISWTDSFYRRDIGQRDINSAKS